VAVRKKYIKRTQVTKKLPSFKTNEELWDLQAQALPWFKKWTKTIEWNEPFAHWFVDGQINASYACLDTHLQSPELKNKVAIFWEDEAGHAQQITYSQLYQQVNNFAYYLRQKGVNKGDIVVIYMPMVAQAVAAILAVARLGATHTVVFSGFSASALKDRICDTQAKFLITCDQAFYRNKAIMLKAIADEAVSGSPSIEKVFVIERESVQMDSMLRPCSASPRTDSLKPGHIGITQNRELTYNFQEHKTDTNFVEAVAVESNHPLFILYTSGTTGKPKGIVHSTGGYLTYVYSTIKWALDINKDSVYWCTADIGWITGHSYVVYGPLMHGAAIVMREGAPDWPDASAWWKVIERYKVSIFYTSPTALRMFMKLGNHIFNGVDLSSLKILGSVGEPINPEVWLWFNDLIGQKMCPLIDTWWQTETGGFMIAPTAGLDLIKLKPGSATLPLPGVNANIVDSNNSIVKDQNKGYLVIKNPWPGMTIGIYKNPELFKQAYWTKFPGSYFSGDYAIKDKDGYFWLLGRADEVLNIAGHRVGTAEVESATLEHNAVAETAVVGIKDDIKGEAIIVFTTLKNGFAQSPELKREIVQTIRKQIGAFATPKDIYFVEHLPKTRSGKIMRRILKAIVQGDQIGDISTLEDGASVEEIKLIYQSFRQTIQKISA